MDNNHLKQQSSVRHLNKIDNPVKEKRNEDKEREKYSTNLLHIDNIPHDNFYSLLARESFHLNSVKYRWKISLYSNNHSRTSSGQIG